MDRFLVKGICSNATYLGWNIPSKMSFVILFSGKGMLRKLAHNADSYLAEFEGVRVRIENATRQDEKSAVIQG